MKAILIAILLAFGASFTVFKLSPARPHVPPSSGSADSAFDASAPVEARIAALEQAVTEERAARQMLEDQLIFLMTEQDDAMPAPAERVDPDTVATEPPGDSSVSRRRPGNSREKRLTRLIENGFDPAQADWVIRREADLQMQALQARYKAGRTGDYEDYYQRQRALRNTLRADLGDADFEKYLAANGQGTEIRVSVVLDSSPAQAAGMQPGDRILRYDGKRVFNMDELAQHSMDGTPGENVVLNIVRDDVPMQIVLPRGPLGVTGGR